MDDESADKTFETVRNRFLSQNLTIIRNNNEKLASECRNIGLLNAKGKYVFFIDDDVVIDSNALKLLVQFMEEHLEVGVVAPIIMYLDKPTIVWCAGIKIDLWTTLGTFIERNKFYIPNNVPINCDAVPTAFMVRLPLARRLGFNTKLFPIQYEELDFCIRANRLGYKIVVAPWIKIWHDANTANFLRNPIRTYFEARNLIIAHKLWSKNGAQAITSRIAAIVTPLLHIAISLKYSKNYRETSTALLRGLRDGLAISKNLRSYDLSTETKTGSPVENSSIFA